MQPISADSHVVEGPEVFAGLADRFGDDAPRVVRRDNGGQYIEIPAGGNRTVNVGMMALAATRLDRDQALGRRAGHKPDVSSMYCPPLSRRTTRGASSPNRSA
ncbi:MAG: hypothetical protein AAFN30_19185, partial [Actinomycetota bacterium]